MSFTAGLNRHLFTVSIAFSPNPSAGSIRWAELIMEEIDLRHRRKAYPATGGRILGGA
jgi:hypothetical protein